VLWKRRRAGQNFLERKTVPEDHVDSTFQWFELTLRLPDPESFVRGVSDYDGDGPSIG